MFGNLRYNIGTARNSNGPVPFACIKPWTASQKARFRYVTSFSLNAFPFKCIVYLLFSRITFITTEIKSSSERTNTAMIRPTGISLSVSVLADAVDIKTRMINSRGDKYCFSLHTQISSPVCFFWQQQIYMFRYRVIRVKWYRVCRQIWTHFVLLLFTLMT